MQRMYVSYGTTYIMVWTHGKTMSDRKRGAALDEVLQSFLDILLGRRIQSAR